MTSLNAPRPRKRNSITDLVFTAILGVLQLVTSLVLSSAGWLQLMSVASCSENACDFGLLEFSGYLTGTVAVIALVGVLVFALLRALRARSTWWVPFVGLGAVVSAYVVATTLNQLARS